MVIYYQIGGPYAEKLASIFDEFKRWREILDSDYANFALAGKGALMKDSDKFIV